MIAGFKTKITKAAVLHCYAPTEVAECKRGILPTVKGFLSESS
jgi:hypothetical protein